MTYVKPPFVSEAQPGVDVDCVGCSAISVVDGHKPGTLPATLAEAKVLRTAAGYGATAGETVEAIAAAVKAKTGIAPAIIGSSFATLWSALTPGRAAFLIGRVENVATTSPFRKHQGDFIGLHCDSVARLDSTDRVWLVDPEGPVGVGYTGEWATKADLQRFYVGDAGVLSLAVKVTLKKVVRKAAARPNAFFGAAFGTFAVGEVLGITGQVSGARWYFGSSTGTGWYVVATVNGHPVSAVFPGHALAYVADGAF